MSADGIFIAVLIVGLIVAYFVLMFLKPEWVGISGQKAKQIQKEHVQAPDPERRFDSHE